MPATKAASQSSPLNLLTKKQLDEMTVGVGFTLISLAQGLSLSKLASRASQLLTTERYIAWLYVLAGFIVVRYFWSQAILHA